MKFLILLFVAAYCEARPNQAARAALWEPGFGSFILGGTDASPGEFPWQLSQERLGTSWSHSCGASLLSANRGLSAAHCVDGADVSILRVRAGVHDRSNSPNAVTSNLAYTKHESYDQGTPTFNNDIAILTLATSIGVANGIGYAILPADNSNSYAGNTCVISGWGRTSSSNTLPNILQKVSIGVITEADCNSRLAPVSGANVGAGQICLYDTAATAGSCNGDSGGPLNCQDGGRTVVAGVTSWGIQSGGACAPSYPSIYTRTSNYLAWISSHL